MIHKVLLGGRDSHRDVSASASGAGMFLYFFGSHWLSGWIVVSDQHFEMSMWERSTRETYVGFARGVRRPGC